MPPYTSPTRLLALPLLALALSLSGCSATSDGPNRVQGAGASGGTHGGNAGASGFGGGAGTGGGLFLDSGTTGDAAVTDGGGVTNDARPDVTTGECTNEGYRPGPFPRVCAAPTDNECAGNSDVNPSFPNGNYGNGFDDDCDGQVDEGCDCSPGIGSGETRDCWLVPGSQVDASGTPLGWCASNSRGSQSCVVTGSGEFPTRRWDTQCRGAQPPFADDVCAAGDFNCDGLELNSQAQDCSCDNVVIECPSDAVVTAPYPNPTNLLELNGYTWISGADPLSSTNWRWTVTGGDCDNILPFPSFAVYNGSNANSATRVGAAQGGLGPAGNQRGYVWPSGSGITAGRVYPAFALSGDYLVKGEFQINGQQHECTIRVQVRAPGIRAEACWSPMPNDLDLHFARLQNPTACDKEGHGWFHSCRSDNRADDCFYASSSGCTGFGVNPSPWGYARSPNSACQGWGSRRGANPCDNPRLDRDNVTCFPSLNDPNLPNFCGAENINLDNPKDGERFAIGLHAYDVSGTVRPHVNIYCNGERRLSAGYDPNSGQLFPAMTQDGATTGGDLWEVAIVQAHVDSSGQMTDCTIDTVDSQAPKAAKDGSTAICVDTNPKNGPVAEITDWLFQADGNYPATANDMCWH